MSDNVQGDRPPAESLARLIFVIYLPALCFLAAVVVAARRGGLPVGDLTRDPLQILNQPPYLGIVSNVGVLLWCMAASIALLAATAVPADPRRGETKRFLLWTGLLSALVLLDDLFMFHEIVIPQLTHIDEHFVYMVYIAIGIGYAVRFRRELLGDSALLVLLATAFMTVSLVTDQGYTLSLIFGRKVVPDSYFLEDGSKFLAQASWAGFVARRALRALTG